MLLRITALVFAQAISGELGYGISRDDNCEDAYANFVHSAGKIWSQESQEIFCARFEAARTCDGCKLSGIADVSITNLAGLREHPAPGLRELFSSRQQ